MNTASEQLRLAVNDRLKEQEPMSRHTNFRIGGPAKYFVEVRSIEELKKVLDIAKTSSMPTVVIGGGSNMLVADHGFNGIMIKLLMREIFMDKNRVQAGAGVPMILLSRKIAEASLAGLEWAITLPGTVGGAIRGNAGCFGGETRDHLVEAFVLSNGEVVSRTNAELAFGYRESAIKHSLDIVLSATFELKSGDQSIIKQIMESNLAKRKASQPLDAGSAGCMFKNYEITSDEELQRIQSKLDLTSEAITSRRISAGWIVDQVDLKGFEIGGAKVSPVHGNFLVNTGSATADEVIQLIAFIKTRVRDAYGIILQEEVQYVGF
ncbi:UDP-N-acetylenolpyruvoylglucosamine reductase [Candidatus Uhrbacteria bacterium RIFCSPHIGHO2_02_FULL_47_44]|uniref:UDP-N-acetylenolpyruvoylglucosamine reductase n=1 Tax=Candidatus Uhrbacteria bacterium RIFCSPLOWO2_02_FULL_48_18 TaxID=1802408 RepID=A0A1F7VBZ7_9BACT|nr:MAG: UDP-N-acetylenolpyruvoylglucosamine reductase [Candidatus Uhrbacteria bacterium RIFCSPHIGHO2_01_FULL_47_10]OGL70471.1 MAG: UDP-N-acetylenolpyruvoylglucosamine reductase [Candidatus Uhrbacteria bacterium RIFCSPHIGHO2_02_FULL_47_44]OGL76837.1 MAG: UDP-N-acetylenolpyruvoylglucosamine reductase [Candidatus Uhrbacteria bacterium RIFCSPHIGHO2_12_FULL_47_12]OGL82306.1 MAG: UDP-N-acetylenolpyruvoylglucosamine reductase [Candidatus Uhrbacteria bacterium RIFCSPLOWO2_01_FULL_47_17]OGL87953.1 MAG: 